MSHDRAAKAQKDGLFDDEIVKVEIPQRKGDPILFSEDEGVRGGTTARVARRAAPGVRQGRQHHRRQRLADLRRRRRRDRGSKAAAEKLGVDPLGRDRRLRPGGRPRPVAAAPSPPAPSSRRSSAPATSVGDLDLFELNEAFAAVGVASMADLGITDDITNVNGGAIALGHPIGMSGNRVALTLLHELERRGGGMGAAALCGGGGQGDAILLETI